MPLIVLSQKDYPKTSVIEYDTVIIFKIEQAKTILKQLTHKDFLEKQAKLDSLLLLEKDLQINTYKEIIENNESIISVKDDMLLANDFTIQQQEAVIKSYISKERRHKIRNWSLVIGGVAAAITTFILL